MLWFWCRSPPQEPWELPSRPADASAAYKTSSNQALLYRLNGDTNPLHADPAMAAMGGACSYCLGLLLGGWSGSLPPCESHHPLFRVWLCFVHARPSIQYWAGVVNAPHARTRAVPHQCSQS